MAVTEAGYQFEMSGAKTPTKDVDLEPSFKRCGANGVPEGLRLHYQRRVGTTRWLVVKLSLAPKRTNSSFPVLPINDRTLGVLMSAWIFVIGLVLLWVGMSSRLERRERRKLELAALNNPIKVAAFWGHDARAERQAYVDKVAEHSNWRGNVRFQVINWTIFGIGAALCVLGTVLWLGEDRTPTWDRLWDLVGPFVVAAVGIYYVYQLMKRLDKAENEVQWLSLMLKQVKDNGQVNYSELERRLDGLEGKSDRG